METIDLRQAQAHLTSLIERLPSEGGFIIAKGGKPVAKLVSLASPDADNAKRLGFMVGQLKVPPDFDEMGADEIVERFDLGDDP